MIVLLDVSYGQNINFRSQEEVDQFDQSITEITGNVTIGNYEAQYGERISNLDALSNLERIDGDLYFKGLFTLES